MVSYLARRAKKLVAPINPLRLTREVDSLYTMLYHLVHDLDASPNFSALQTKDSFGFQWRRLEDGLFLLTDPWFKEQLTRIICQEEVLLKPEWFAGRKVLDAGCGNGRWAYGLASLGAHVTAVDINESAVEATRKALASLGTQHHVIQSPLEKLDRVLAGKQFDLVWSWGVLHHCQSFSQALRAVTEALREGGVLYLYLYGRESLSYAQDLEFFKERIRYNVLPSWEAKREFLLTKAHGKEDQLHNLHDQFAPLINRRFHFATIEAMLRTLGFTEVTRTVAHTEVFVRAIKGDNPSLREWYLPQAQPPYWFERHPKLK